MDNRIEKNRFFVTNFFDFFYSSKIIKCIAFEIDFLLSVVVLTVFDQKGKQGLLVLCASAVLRVATVVLNSIKRKFQLE